MSINKTLLFACCIALMHAEHIVRITNNSNSDIVVVSLFKEVVSSNHSSIQLPSTPIFIDGMHKIPEQGWPIITPGQTLELLFQTVGHIILRLSSIISQDALLKIGCGKEFDLETNRMRELLYLGNQEHTYKKFIKDISMPADIVIKNDYQIDLNGNPI